MKSPAYQWYPKDIISSSRVSMMSLLEEGAYRRALDYCWLNGSLPSDLKSLAKLIGKGCSIKAAEIVKSMFQVDPNDSTKLIHERLEVERVKQIDWRVKSRKGGLKSSENKATKIQPPFNHPSTKNEPPLKNGYNQKPTLQSSSSSSNITNVIYLSKEANSFFNVHLQKYAGLPSQLIISDEYKNSLDQQSYGKGLEQNEILVEFDKEFSGKDFSNSNHVKNAIGSIIKKLTINKAFSNKKNINQKSRTQQLHDLYNQI